MVSFSINFIIISSCPQVFHTTSFCFISFHLNSKFKSCTSNHILIPTFCQPFPTTFSPFSHHFLFTTHTPVLRLFSFFSFSFVQPTFFEMSQPQHKVELFTPEVVWFQVYESLQGDQITRNQINGRMTTIASHITPDTTYSDTTYSCQPSQPHFHHYQELRLHQIIHTSFAHSPHPPRPDPNGFTQASQFIRLYKPHLPLPYHPLISKLYTDIYCFYFQLAYNAHQS